MEQAADVVQVLVVDDRRRSRSSERSSPRAGIQLAGEATSGEEAIELVDRMHPSVVLMDINMGAMDGLEAARIITTSHPEDGDPRLDVLSKRHATGGTFVRRSRLRQQGRAVTRVVRRLWEAGGSGMAGTAGLNRHPTTERQASGIFPSMVVPESTPPTTSIVPPAPIRSRMLRNPCPTTGCIGSKPAPSSVTFSGAPLRPHTVIDAVAFEPACFRHSATPPCSRSRSSFDFLGMAANHNLGDRRRGRSSRPEVPLPAH
jgi:CheY-like chemotaxis protein